jgi:hypothetical protein
MGKADTIRFASGSPSASFSSVWRLVVTRDDVFIGASKKSMGIFKISLHKSGVWVLSATEQSGATFRGGNRRAKQWKKPLEHARGVTRGPSVLVPHTSLGSRPLLPDDDGKNILWFAGPESSRTVEFSLYFVAPESSTQWDPDQTVLAERHLFGGSRLILLASSRPSPADFLETVEKLVRDNVVRMKDPSAFKGGSFLWVTQSADALQVPLIVDLPVPIGPELGSAGH